MSVLTACCLATPVAAAISCTTTMTNVAFGAAVNVLPATPVNVTATQTITCNGAAANSTYRFCTDIRSGTDVSGTQRRMASGANRLNFDLYKDAGHTVPWGHYSTIFLGGGSQNDFTSNGAGNISGTVTLFAVLAGNQQTAIPASYSENMNGGTTNDMQYGSLASAGACPIGGSTTQYTFTVTATVAPTCIISTTILDFGTVLNLSSAVNVQPQSIKPTCTSGTTYTIGLNAGTGTGATLAVRKMTFGANTINYSIYTNAGHTTVWGAGTVSSTGTGNQQLFQAFGQVPAQALPNPGTYTDTIIATVTY
jgi:spore coat protein U-like protein